MITIELLGYIVLLIGSIAVLGNSARYVVDKAARLAKFFGVSELAVGFILIAVLTSLPELSVAVLSATAGEGNISMGDVTGSNVTNIALVLGACGLVGFGKKFRSSERANALVLLFFSLVPLLLVIDGQLTSLDSMILLALFVMFVGYIFMNRVRMNNTEVITKKEAAKDFIIFLVSMGVVMISAGVVVHSATVIAEDLGLFKSFIGATIIALGTSLPELAVDTTAVRRGKVSMALGDIVGSNVVNLTLVLGINAMINPFAPNLKMIGPVMLFILAAVALLAFFLWKNKTISKRDGLVLLGLYALYIIAASGVQIFQLGQ